MFTKKANGSQNSERLQLTIEEELKRQTELLAQTDQNLRGFARTYKQLVIFTLLWLFALTLAVGWLIAVVVF